MAMPTTRVMPRLLTLRLSDCLQARDFASGPIVGRRNANVRGQRLLEREPLHACVKLCSAASMRERKDAAGG
jgi:hypothetical protein